MFVQQSSSASQFQQVSKVNAISKDFDLIVDFKSRDILQGKIVFYYLQQYFEASIKVSDRSIQVIAKYPLSGIKASAPVLQKEELAEQAYLHNGSLTNLGNQNIIWLLFDLIHLYNMLRLKPNALLELYREVFTAAKENNVQIAFGHIGLNPVSAKTSSKLLAQKMKRKYKYAYGNSLDLLNSVEQMIAHYPQQFILPKTVSPKASPVLS